MFSKRSRRRPNAETPGPPDCASVTVVFVIRMLDGEEIHAADPTEVTINPTSGVLTIHRLDRQGDITTHYSPMAWRSVSHRLKRGAPS